MIDIMEVEDRTEFGNGARRGNHSAKFKRLLPIFLAIETSLIVLIVTYILWQSATSGPSNSPMATEDPFATPTIDHYTVYSNGSRSSKFLLSLAHNCNLRKHDLNYGAKCQSSDIANCQHQVMISKSPGKSINKRKRRQVEYSQQQQQVATQISSTKSGLRFYMKHVSMQQVDCRQVDCKFKTKLLVDLSQTEQEIIGWGGALTDSSINNILSLTTNGTRQLLNDYFGEEGLKYNMIRITIGGSDFSSRFYTNDDLNMDQQSNSTDDVNIEKFKLREEDVLYKIPMLKLIQEEYKEQLKIRGDLKLFASMWSPPVWMKTNEHFNKGQLKGSISDKLDVRLQNEKYYHALVTLKKKFLLAYIKESVNFWGLTVMNEPLFAIQPFLNFNTMIFPPDDYANYIAKYLGPMIRSDRQLKHLKLMAHDDNRRYLMNFTEPILARKEVKYYIDAISTHGYTDLDYSLMSKMYGKYKTLDNDFFILPTELCSGHLPFMEKALIGNWDRGIHYGLDIIYGLQNAASGWVDWNMVLDTSGGPGWLGGRLDSPIIVDKANDSYYKSPMYYALGQFSRYIEPRSSKLKTSISNDEYKYHFETVTFLSPNKNDLVTVVLNNNPYNIDLYIRQKESSSSIIDTNVDTEDDQGGIYFQVTCPADSITTFIYPRMANNSIK